MQNRHGGGRGERVDELPPHFIEFPFFYLPIYFIFKIFPSVIITVIKLFYLFYFIYFLFLLSLINNFYVLCQCNEFL